MASASSKTNGLGSARVSVSPPVNVRLSASHDAHSLMKACFLVQRLAANLGEMLDRYAKKAASTEPPPATAPSGTLTSRMIGRCLVELAVCAWMAMSVVPPPTSITTYGSSLCQTETEGASECVEHDWKMEPSRDKQNHANNEQRRGLTFEEDPKRC